MRTKLVALCMGLVGLIGFCPAQDQKLAKENMPQKLGIVYQVKDGNLVDLERQVPKIKSKGGMGALFTNLATSGIYTKKIKTVFIMNGGTSPVRVTHNRPTFAVRILTGYDPRTIHLVPFVRKGKERNSVTSEVGGWFGLEISAEQGYPTIPIDVIPSDENPSTVYLVPAADLIPGEYAFACASAPDVFCFGVDKG